MTRMTAKTSTAANRKHPLRILAWAGAGIACLLLILYLGTSWPGKASREPSPTATTSTPRPDPAPAPAEPGTLASAWQWPDDNTGSTTADGTAVAAADSIPFSADGLYEALQNVRIDANGDVILDGEALNALNRTLRHGAVELSEQNLADLRELIRVGLPGKAGEQTARVVTDYYQYLGAEEEFNDMYETNSGEPADPEVFQRQYEELQALRELYLGEEVAKQLFAEADAGVRYMLDVRRIESDPALTDEEKTRELEALNTRLQNETIAVDNWNERRASFQEERQRILDAGLSEAEKQAQVKALLEQHFEPEEREKIRHLGLDDL